MSDDEMHDNASDDMQMDDSAPNVEENEGVETELTTDGGLKKTILKKGEGYRELNCIRRLSTPGRWSCGGCSAADGRSRKRVTTCLCITWGSWRMERFSIPRATAVSSSRSSLDKAALLRLRRTRIFPQLQTRHSRLRDVSRSCNPAHMVQRSIWYTWPVQRAATHCSTQHAQGWDKGVATMKKGETAVLTCRADYAYGDSGSPPKIPGGATLQFEVRTSAPGLRSPLPTSAPGLA